jgi:hypothetical protein
MKFKVMRALCIKEKNPIRVTIYTSKWNMYTCFHIYTSKWNISIYHIFQLNDTKYTLPRTLQYRMHNSTSNIHFRPSSNVQYQLRARISPEITCKNTLNNSNNEISTLQVMHKNLKLTESKWDLLKLTAIMFRNNNR